MAIQDILTAIEQDTAQKLDAMRRQHQQDLITLKRESEDRQIAFHASVGQQKKEKLKQLDLKVQGLVQQKRRHLLTTTKQRLLDDLYLSLLEKLAKQPEANVSDFLKKKIGSLAKHHGMILPAKAHQSLCARLVEGHSHLKLGEPISSVGGFRFVSDKMEYDMTFESLVKTMLRPKTELSATTKLFS